MIIELSAAFDDFTAQQWANEQQAIEPLIMAHANGWHLLSMSRKTAQSLVDNCDLSGLQKTVLRDHIIPRLTNIVSQGNSLDYGVLCVPQNMQITRTARRVTLPLSYFSNPEASLPAYLIVESIEGDGEFIRFLCGLLGSELGFSSRASLTFLAGGGGSTANRYQEVGDSGRAALCVVDSDSLYLGGPLGVTAAAVRRVQVTGPLARAKILPVREMENLIPQDALCLVYESNSVVRRHVNNIKDFVARRVDQSGVQETVFGHYDVKEGVTRSFISRVDLASQIIWQEMWAHMDPTERLFDVSDSDAHQIVIAPISPRAIAATIDYFQRKPHTRRSFVRAVRSHPFREIIENLVSDVLSLTAASDRLRVPLRAA